MTNRITQADLDTERARYMDREITHAEYYEWLADAIGVTTANLPVSLDRIRASTDEYLNDIPLHRWDAMDFTVRHYARGLAWSLSDTVCMLKAVARRACLFEDMHDLTV